MEGLGEGPEGCAGGTVAGGGGTEVYVDGAEAVGGETCGFEEFFEGELVVVVGVVEVELGRGVAYVEPFCEADGAVLVGVVVVEVVVGDLGDLGSVVEEFVGADVDGGGGSLQMIVGIEGADELRVAVEVVGGFGEGVDGGGSGECALSVVAVVSLAVAKEEVVGEPGVRGVVVFVDRVVVVVGEDGIGDDRIRVDVEVECSSFVGGRDGCFARYVWRGGCG